MLPWSLPKRDPSVRGKNTANKVSTVQGYRQRLIAVFSYFDRPGVVFSKEEQIGFYGRTAS